MKSKKYSEKEAEKCQKDPIYFLAKYGRIKTEDGNLRPFTKEEIRDFRLKQDFLKNMPPTPIKSRNGGYIFPKIVDKYKDVSGPGKHVYGIQLSKW